LSALTGGPGSFSHTSFHLGALLVPQKRRPRGVGPTSRHVVSINDE
jgi:hypothetical protein